MFQISETGFPFKLWTLTCEVKVLFCHIPFCPFARLILIFISSKLFIKVISSICIKIPQNFLEIVLRPQYNHMMAYQIQVFDFEQK